MKNAHLRFGSLTYVKSTEKTTTSIKLRLDRFIGEVLPDPPRQAKAHLISVIGGDTQVAAISAAISLGDRFMVEGPGCAADPRLSRTKRTVFQRLGTARRAQKASASPCRVVGRVRFQQRVGGLGTNPAGKLGEPIHLGLSRPYSRNPGMPEWADWFAGELETHKAIIRALGIGCAPVLVKGEKEQFLSWLSWGVESGAVSLPAETGSIRWPSLSLEDLFLPAN